MIKEESSKDGSHKKEGDGPRSADIMAASFKKTGKDDEAALSRDHGEAVEGCSNPNISGLEVLGEPQHVKAVGSSVMGCRAEGHQPEEGKGILEESSSRDSERNAGE